MKFQVLGPQAAVAGIQLLCCAAPLAQIEQPRAEAEAQFLAETDAAMATMMRDMTIAPTGNVDHDFAAAIIPHHQGAIDMSIAELRHGANEQLRRIAEEIVVDHGIWPSGDGGRGYVGLENCNALAVEPGAIASVLPVSPANNAAHTMLQRFRP
jgi:hypothetical protein